jgi:hypothetical protein
VGEGGRQGGREGGREAGGGGGGGGGGRRRGGGGGGGGWGGRAGRDSTGYATELPSNPEVERGIGFLAAAETYDVMVPTLVKSETMDL